jgi:hypothetical protein
MPTEYMSEADAASLTAALRQMGFEAESIKVLVKQAASTPVDRSAYGRVWHG